MMTILFVGLILVSAFLALLFWVQRRTGNAAIADVGWTGGIALLVVMYAITLADQTLRTWVIALLASFWALRLTYHVLIYRVIGKPEDGRYTAMRNYWGDRANSRLFLFFQGQAIAAWLFALPALAAMLAPRASFSGWDWLGLAIWVIAIVGESIADHQLESFRSNPDNKGKTCRAGLWHYSRHPNYFFEWIHWFAYVAFAMGHAAWWFTLLGPLVMLVTLFRFTGIPYTENQAVKSRGADYRRYQQTTSSFIPWPPNEKGERI